MRCLIRKPQETQAIAFEWKPGLSVDNNEPEKTTSWFYFIRSDAPCTSVGNILVLTKPSKS